MRHKRSQNTGVVYTLVDGLVAVVNVLIGVVNVLMRISSRIEGQSGSLATGG